MDSQNNKQTGKNKNFIQAFGHAYDGIKWVFIHERNFKFDMACAVITMGLGFILRIRLEQFMWLLTAIILVLVGEILNTVVERIMDFMSDHHYDERVKVIKDVAAGGVVLTAIFAIVVGLFVFVPKIIELLN
ncbi:diacylglycerol kinase family protein [Fructilactobacillus fructivorans]|uniref:Diacylglycerol kinase n=1 Tax=Fructilactobacillus fructivorans TaxID=1614 RepID=A0A0C1M0H2_9LACO|nr:diacylglycerol kinase family protein [Fructilactobacillus fructivorans]KID42620.1 Diacylglycerol kinase [Fructilactobacillus fructivorans]MCT0151846.1 diacylglycerol kinase family protein [Fructilactobacillus fructivorans]MCT2868025.1 diacylglycerol kinase family protein [Fructilactobacillus fructivorans]MCT2868677.1 diacylglycerol kinase family protein [Fructilactobacillus fructivorans]MCT2873392.1 diacylglycerol kinase family protein [Fructilactobacillus fructivorans]